ncbi:cation diffusion facilitator family transporter [Marinobacter nanhaiticus D15-8W]|uniref:Cation transporter n=1 Tax=Marinobacter nanhaiticus D15-8W TaxID=626887 RepID=N6X630_9GAMM|nr:cation diffusion facilitator family transporter [Marinobacter nanhaiticus]ENO16558.1 cation transporter [Marinobacter nanhaiticus D15-8W]BES72350.1 cation diffusion facilitator family transporter [Marinobacter nanhaiticus D15-8W]
MAHSHSHQQGHSHGHAHGHHAHGHSHGTPNSRAFAIGIALNVIFVVVEAVYGVLADSMALLADAGHNLSDVLGLMLAWGAAWLAQRQATKWRTYGLKKTTILAALLNALVLMFAIGGIAWESIRRFANPAEVAGTTVIVVALVGVVINTATMMLFMRGQKEDLNIRGAFLHMAADAGISLGVAVAGGLILWTGLQWIDPVVSLAIVVVILIGTWGLLRESLNLSLDAVPSGIDPDQVREMLVDLPGVEDVHHVHIWGMSTTENALTAHLVKPDPHSDDALLETLEGRLRKEFNISHVTIQWERNMRGCPMPDHC